MSPTNVPTSPIKCHQHDSPNVGRIRRPRWTCLSGQGKPMKCQPYPKNHRQLRNAGSGRGVLPKGRAHQSVIQYHTANPWNIHTNNIWLSVLYLGLYLYVWNNQWKKRPWTWRQGKVYGSIWREEEEGTSWLYYNLEEKSIILVENVTLIWILPTLPKMVFQFENFIQFNLTIFFHLLQLLPDSLSLSNSCFFSFLKKTNAHTHPNKMPKPQSAKSHGMHFVIVIYSWASSQSWSLADVPSVILLKKAEFPLLQRLPVSASSSARAEALCPLPFLFAGIV